MYNKIKIKFISNFLKLCVEAIFFLIGLIFSFTLRFLSRFNYPSVRIVWGSTPLINNAYWSMAMKDLGYTSKTYTEDFYVSIHSRSDWDMLLKENYTKLPTFIKPYFAFIHSLYLFDIFVISCDGYFLNDSFFWKTQALFFKIARKKIVLIPYGSDSYVYQRVRSTSLLHGLLMSYPIQSRKQKYISKRLDFWCKHADVVIPGLMGPEGFGRWDILSPSPLVINTSRWLPKSRINYSNGLNGKVVIAHCPNHRGFKGSEFVIDAIEKLKSEGFNIELLILEKLQNVELMQRLQNDVDILIEQLIFGHGLNAIEGMACGLPTISNLEDETYILPFRRWSFFDECPLVSASPESVVDVLRKLITRPELRHQIGQASREYVEKYHGLDSAQYMFTNVIDYLYGKKESLINLYHPLLGEYPNRSPKIQHPLVNNQIVD